MASYFSFYDYCLNELLGVNNEKFEIIKATSKLSLIYPFDDCCIVSQKPSTIRMVDGVLHCDGGPSIEYSDGFRVWALWGVAVPAWVAETPAGQLDSKKIIALRNADQRRVAIQKVGAEKLCYDLNAKILDTARDGMYELLLCEFDGRKWPYLKMRNPSLSTADNEVWHVEGVGANVRTVQDAMIYRINGDGQRNYKFDNCGSDWWIHGDVIIVPRGAKTLKQWPVAVA